MGSVGDFFLELADNDFVRSGITQAINKLRDFFTNSEGKGLLSVPASVINFGKTVYDQVFNMVSSFLPDSFSLQSFDLSKWTGLGDMIREISGMQDTLRTHFNANWLVPISKLTYLEGKGDSESADAYLDRMLQSNDTVTIARTAKTILEKYRKFIGPTVSAGIGNKDSAIPIAEPGGMAIISTKENAVETVKRNQFYERDFYAYIEDVEEMFHRIHPNFLVVVGDSIIMDKYSKQLLPDIWYKTTKTYTNFLNSASSGTFGYEEFRFGDDQTFTGANSPIYTIKLENKNNLVISPGMDYGLKMEIGYCMRGGPLVNPVDIEVITTDDSETRSTGTANTPITLLAPIDMLLTNNPGLNDSGNYLTFSVDMSSASANIPANADLRIFIKWCISVNSKVDFEQKADALVSHYDAGKYRSISESTVWGDLYGGELIENGEIDQDLSIVGYIDNYLTKPVAMKVVAEIIQAFIDDSQYKIQLFSLADETLQLQYRGKDGFIKLLEELSIKGPMALLDKTGVMFNGERLKKRDMCTVITRLLDIIKTIRTDYKYGEASAVAAVKKVMDPRGR
jgi:hypothetical protein